jgi:peptidoglycan/xylan/chitin deacetylase (PgdA/CDA1 family)
VSTGGQAILPVCLLRIDPDLSDRQDCLSSKGRRFLIVALLLLLSPGLLAQTRSVAVTFDDLPGLYVTTCDADAYRRMNQQLVDAIRGNAMPALGLINESKLCPEKRGQLASILGIWLDAGLDLGNHTFSHVDFNTSTIAEF